MDFWLFIFINVCYLIILHIQNIHVKELHRLIKVLRRNLMSKPCPNCKEKDKKCACMRNKCIECEKPVGNITFTVCDDCWDK